MKCPRCSYRDTRVLDTRIGKSGLTIRRRRSCPACDFRFTTVEERIPEDLYVEKADGRREPYDKRKIYAGLKRACEKRPVDVEQLEVLINEVTAELESEFDHTIPSRAIGERVMNRLRSIDQIAYVRFASVYKDFRDIHELAQEISELRDRAAPAISPGPPH